MKQFNLEFGSTFYNYACPMYIDFALYFVIFNECSCILVRANPFYIWGVGMKQNIMIGEGGGQPKRPHTFALRKNDTRGRRGSPYASF